MRSTTTDIINLTHRLGLRFKLLRGFAGLAQSEAAKQLNMSASLLSKLESGDEMLSVPKLHAYAKLLGVDLCRLIPTSAEINAKLIDTEAEGRYCALLYSERTLTAKPMHEFVIEFTYETFKWKVTTRQESLAEAVKASKQILTALGMPNGEAVVHTPEGVTA